MISVDSNKFETPCTLFVSHDSPVHHFSGGEDGVGWSARPARGSDQLTNLRISIVFYSRLDCL